MSSTRQAVFAAIAILATLLVGLLVLELAFGGWLRGHDPWTDVARMNVIRDRKMHYDATAVYGAGHPGLTYTRDRWGLRGTCSRMADVQVVTIGGSTTDQRYVDDGLTWQDELQRRLRTAPGPPNLCVANAGVDGHTTFGHRLALERWFPLIPEFHPHVYLLYVGINDAPLRFDPNAGSDARTESFEALLSDKSALYNLLRTLRHLVFGDKAVAYAGHAPGRPGPQDYRATRPTAGIEPLVAKNAAQFEQRLGGILEIIRARGGVPVCVSQPSRIYSREPDGSWRGVENVFTAGGRAYNGLDFRLSILALDEVLQRRCTAAGGHYVDLESAPLQPEDFYDLVHTLPSGSRKLGELLHAAFLAQGVLDTAAP
jgi:lysophospholipase L1-like esterase